MNTTNRRSELPNTGAHANNTQEWTEREHTLREKEWEMADTLLATARALFRRFLFRQKHEPTLAEITRMLDLASHLGRLATGLANRRQEVSASWSEPQFDPEWERALIKIYGPKASLAANQQNPQPSSPAPSEVPADGETINP
jgi:hypothetical protein